MHTPCCTADISQANPFFSARVQRLQCLPWNAVSGVAVSRTFGKTATFKVSRQRPFLQVYKLLSCQPSSAKSRAERLGVTIWFARCLSHHRETSNTHNRQLKSSSCLHFLWHLWRADKSNFESSRSRRCAGRRNSSNSGRVRNPFELQLNRSISFVNWEKELWKKIHLVQENSVFCSWALNDLVQGKSMFCSWAKKWFCENCNKP